MSRFFLLGVLALFGMAGCTTVGNFPPDGKVPESVSCHGSHCSVPVGASCFGFLCRALVSDQVIVERGESSAATTLNWQLPEETDLRFARDGIVFETEGFTCRATGDKQFQCADSAGPGRYKYTVKLEWRNHTFRPLDPWAVNR